MFIPFGCRMTFFRPESAGRPKIAIFSPPNPPKHENTAILTRFSPFQPPQRVFQVILLPHEHAQYCRDTGGALILFKLLPCNSEMTEKV